MQYPLFEDHHDLERIVNTAQVKHRSPFRYPGGKTWLVPRIRQWLTHKGKTPEFIEPFCGGAIVGLSVMFEGLAEHVTLIELDPQIAAVWQILLKGSDPDVKQLIQRIYHFQMNRKNVIDALEATSQNTLDIAFLTILKNRVNHGGCLAQGTGLIREGENRKGIGSRWYPATIVKRINDIQSIRHKVSFFNQDGIAFIEKEIDNPSTTYFIDPPYWVAGRRLYDFSMLDHEYLFKVVSQAKGDFLMTYDNVGQINDYARQHGLETQLISMQNKNHDTKKELLISRDFSWLKNCHIAE